MKYLESCTPIPLLTSPLKGEEPCSLPFKGRVGVALGSRGVPFLTCSLPFKGRVGVGMGKFLVGITKFSYGHSRKCPFPN